MINKKDPLEFEIVFCPVPRSELSIGGTNPTWCTAPTERRWPFEFHP